jgi:hypothetical protein
VSRKDWAARVRLLRRAALAAGTAACAVARKAGDEAAAARILDEMTALRLLVRDASGELRVSPDVAD